MMDAVALAKDRLDDVIHSVITGVRVHDSAIRLLKTFWQM